MTLGNYPRNQDPCAFIAKNPEKSDSLHSPFYDALYRNAAFYSRMIQLYRSEFLPVLQEMLDGEIDMLAAWIHDASQSNRLRWRTMYDNLPADVVHTPSALKDYFSRRVDFLNSAWLEGKVYCTLQFESTPGSAYKSVSVEKGRCLESAYINTETTVWVDASTGEIFDFRQPVVADRILTKQANYDAAAPDSAAERTSFSIADCFLFLIMATTVILVMVFTGIDLMWRKQERQNTAQSELSS